MKKVSSTPLAFGMRTPSLAKSLTALGCSDQSSVHLNPLAFASFTSL